MPPLLQIASCSGAGPAFCAQVARRTSIASTAVSFFISLRFTIGPRRLEALDFSSAPGLLAYAAVSHARFVSRLAVGVSVRGGVVLAFF